MENNVRVKREYEKGGVIFEQGVFEMCMYDILSGKVGIYANYGKENEKLLTELKEEQYFGEMGLVDALPRSATAVALEKTQVYVIDGKTFGEYFKDRPAKVLTIMQNMSARIRELTDDYMEACKAAAETLEAEKEGKEKAGLLQRLQKFADVYTSYNIYESSRPRNY